MKFVYLVGEDRPTVAAGRVLLRDAGVEDPFIHPIVKNGNSAIRSDLDKYLKLAATFPVLLLTDLDRTACPVALIERWRGTRNFRTISSSVWSFERLRHGSFRITRASPR
jgi:hypothetical protein